MTLKKLILRPGVNRENTSYASENGWWECDKIRFRQGTPEKIGGWIRTQDTEFAGTCRALFSWARLNSEVLLAVGTNLKYYISFGGTYNDITPIRATVTLANPFTTYIGLTQVDVADAAHGAAVGDFVTFSGASAVGGLDLNAEYQITALIDINAYTITAATTATSSAVGGGAAVTAEYQLSAGLAINVPRYGWGAGNWSAGPWGTGSSNSESLRTWSQSNFGEDLIFGPSQGAIYYWDGTGFLSTRAVELSSILGATDVPVIQNFLLVSDVSRFVLAFGVNDYGSSVQDPLLIRWSDQEDALDWTPDVTNQAGSLRLSKGSRIVAAIQARQEILVWTDVALYSLQYLGAPDVWGATLLGDNVTCSGNNAVVYASGIVYWMGADKFYRYDGRISTQTCDLRQYVFGDINIDQASQIFAGTNEAFNETWWFYCTQASTEIDSYVVYNYLENIWYYGSMHRTAWLDRGLNPYPLAADSSRVLYHEYGVDDQSGTNAVPIEAFVSSAEFDIDDGDRFGFVYRILPDLTFRGSSAENPQATITLIPMKNSGSGYGTSIAGSDNASVTRTATAVIEQFTGQVYVRVRGRQMILKIESTGLGTTWQSGAHRIDIRPDGRRG